MYDLCVFYLKIPFAKVFNKHFSQDFKYLFSFRRIIYYLFFHVIEVYAISLKYFNI